MEKRVSYYLSRKNAFTWLTVLMLVVSCVCRLIPGIGGVTESRFWMVTLPVIASVWLISDILIVGDELLYKTATPVLLFILYYIVKILDGPQTLKFRLLCCLFYAVIGFLYYEIVDGRFGRRVFLWLIMAGGFALEVRSGILMSMSGVSFAGALPDIFLLLAGVFLISGMKIHLDGKFHPGRGDRSDGRRLRTLNPFAVAESYFLLTRAGSANCLRDRIDTEAVDEFLKKKKEEGLKNISFMHVFAAAYVRCVAKYPALNRFVSGNRIYSRGNDIQFIMAVKNSMSIEGEESMIKLHLSPYDTLDDVYRKLNEEVERVKKNPVGGSDFDKTARVLSLVPGVLFKLTVGLLRLLDYFGDIPSYLLEVSPFHGSIVFTNLASLGIPPVIHHLYDFGNVSIFAAIGAKYNENETGKDGSVIRHRYIDYTVNTDDRIVDGYYYAAVLKYMNKLLKHPEKLELPPAEVNRDID